GAFYEALNAPTHALTDALYSQWQDFFADISGLDPEKLKSKKDLMKFAHQVTNRPGVDPARLLFALYSYSALLVKLLVVAAVTPFFEPDNPDRLSDWSMLDDQELRRRLKEVERGTFFERIVRNFTEGDFFGWYCDEWTPPVAKQVRQILKYAYLKKYETVLKERKSQALRRLMVKTFYSMFAIGEYTFAPF